MHLVKFLFIVVGFCLLGCNSPEEPTAAEIIARTIENAGGERYENSQVEFNFRDRQYTSTRDGGLFKLERVVTDSTGSTRDVLSNDGLQRFQNGEAVKVPDSMVTRISDGVNSVHYFAQLPYGLQAPAVQPELTGKDSIAGEPYYEVLVTFKAEGGGTDHHDEYMYWIHQQRYTVDYLAYKFYTNNGGIRFREAYNPRSVNGIRFVNYQNYKTAILKTALKDLDSLYTAGALDWVSNIRTEEVRVKSLPGS